jgi:LPS sulfotransferase NodH
METQGELQAGLPDPGILLGGQPRSGTTLLSSILRCTPGHFQAFELHIRKPSFVLGLQGRYTRKIFDGLGLPPAEYDRILEQTPKDGMNLGAWVGPKEEVSAEQLTGNETDHFQSELRARGVLTSKLMRRVAELHGRQTWGFKILGDIIYADVYAKVWPNATFILLIRDPRDQAMSVLKLNEERAQRKQQNFYDDYREAARGWRETIERARALIAQHSIRCIETRYEDLVADTQREIKRLSDALDMDLARGLSFHQQDFVQAHTQRFQHHDNLRNSVNAGSVGKWRENLSEQDLMIFREVAGDLMGELRYS